MNFHAMLYQPVLVQKVLPTLQAQFEVALAGPVSSSEVFFQSVGVSEQFTAFRSGEFERFIGFVDVAGMSLEEDQRHKSCEGTTTVLAWNRI
jgi:hypothetical protein